MLRTLRRMSLITVVAAALLLVPAVPVLAAPAFPTPGSIVGWLLDRLPWNPAATDHLAVATETPAPPSESTTVGFGLGDGDPKDLSAVGDGQPGLDPIGLSAGDGLPGLDPDG